MREEGLTVILITHKLNEVMAISDRVTVLRGGKVVGTVNTADTTRQELARMMVGRDVELTVEHDGGNPGDVILDVDSIVVEAASGRGSLKGLSIEVRSGEVVGVAGVSGNGQNALFDVLVGVEQVEEGRVTVHGSDIKGVSAQKISSMGVSGVPGDRINQGLMMDFRVKENLILGRHRLNPFANRGLMRRGPIDEFADKSFDEFEIKAPSIGHVTRTLSGGNLQKVIMARELSSEPQLLVVHQPTRGLDIAASQYVRQRLLEERDRGAAVLLMSEDLDEILNLSDRIAVIYDGRIVGVVPRAEATLEAIGLLMAGITDDDADAPASASTSVEPEAGNGEQDAADSEESGTGS